MKTVLESLFLQIGELEARKRSEELQLVEEEGKHAGCRAQLEEAQRELQKVSEDKERTLKDLLRGGRRQRGDAHSLLGSIESAKLESKMYKEYAEKETDTTQKEQEHLKKLLVDRKAAAERIVSRLASREDVKSLDKLQSRLASLKELAQTKHTPPEAAPAAKAPAPSVVHVAEAANSAQLQLEEMTKNLEFLQSAPAETDELISEAKRDEAVVAELEAELRAISAAHAKTKGDVNAELAQHVYEQKLNVQAAAKHEHKLRMAYEETTRILAKQSARRAALVCERCNIQYGDYALPPGADQDEGDQEMTEPRVVIDQPDSNSPLGSMQTS